MSIQKMKAKIILALLLCLVLLISLTSATFAWFSANRKVTTSRATSRTANAEAGLQLSSTGGDAFNGSEESDIGQVNTTNMLSLLPVSTADLQSFVFCRDTMSDGSTVTFSKVTEYFYHGRVYMRANYVGATANSTIAIYLDKSEAAGGVLATSTDSNSLLLNAARLGLTFNEDPSTSVIFRLSDNVNPESMRKNNTVLYGSPVADGYVLNSSGDTITPVPDPAVSLSDYTVDESAGTFPTKPLFSLTPGTIYPVDVFFWLEGCDADCVDDISLDEGDLHLAFYGVVNE